MLLQLYKVQEIGDALSDGHCIYYTDHLRHVISQGQGPSTAGIWEAKTEQSMLL